MMIKEAMVIIWSRQAFLASPTVRRLKYLCTWSQKKKVCDN